MDEVGYVEQFTVFIDFLGFRNVSRGADELKRRQVLQLLASLAASRGDFAISSIEISNGKSLNMRPAVSTFSDHIVLSYPLDSVFSGAGFSPQIGPSLLALDFNRLIARIAAAALRIGFLIRGGAAIGKLYHSNGVVFGDALVDAYEIESQIAVYPRVVLSPGITQRASFGVKPAGVMKADDGLYQFDYFGQITLAAIGTSLAVDVNSWHSEARAIIDQNLADLENKGHLKEFAKWTWFKREFDEGLMRLNPELLKSLGITIGSEGDEPA